jgi:hypothetical protein
MEVGIALHKLNFGQYKDIFWVVNDVCNEAFPLALVTIRNDGAVEIRFFSIEGKEIGRKQIKGNYSVVAAGIFPEMNTVSYLVEPVMLFGSMNLWAKQEKGKVFVTFIPPIVSEIEELTSEGDSEWVEVDFGTEFDLFMELWKKSYFINRKNKWSAHHITPFISELILRVKRNDDLRILRDRYVYANAKDVPFVIGKNLVNKYVFYFDIEEAEPTYSKMDTVIVRKGTKGYILIWEYKGYKKMILPLKLIPVKLYKGDEVLEKKEFLMDASSVEFVVDGKVDEEIFLGRFLLSGFSLVYSDIDYLAYGLMRDMALNCFLKEVPEEIRSSILKLINTNYELSPKSDNTLLAPYIEEAKERLWRRVEEEEDSVVFTFSAGGELPNLIFDYVTPFALETTNNDIWVGKIEGEESIRIPMVEVILR